MMAMSGSSQPGGSESGKLSIAVWAAAATISGPLIRPSCDVVWSSCSDGAVAPITTSLPWTSSGSSLPLTASANGISFTVPGGPG